MFYISSNNEIRHLILTLWPREAVGGPAEWMSIRAQERVLLLHPEPRVVVLHHAHDLFAGVAQVRLY